MMEGKKNEMRGWNSTYFQYYIKEKQKYNRFLKALPVQLAAIDKFNPKFEVFKSFEILIAENFFKYKEYYQATNLLFKEVIEPFVKSALIKANISEENINTCSQGSCETQLKEAELSLITPTELLKVRYEKFINLHLQIYSTRIWGQFWP